VERRGGHIDDFFPSTFRNLEASARLLRTVNRLSWSVAGMQRNTIWHAQILCERKAGLLEYQQLPETEVGPGTRRVRSLL
jgi:hypothetical protein